jgi:sulfate transport system substrate-binding protein
MQHSNLPPDSPQQPLDFPVAAKLVPFLRLHPVRFTAVLLASGLGLGSAIPALSTSLTTNTPIRRQPTQLISQKPKSEILLVSYAVTKAAYDKIIPKFVAKWKKEKGQDITIRTSYGGSGSQTRAILDGLEADVTALALGADTQKLQKGGLIKAGWEKELPNNSIATKSVVAIVTRPGNPKKIKTWQDLDNAGVRVVTANPKTSGGARWNFLGLWGSVTETGGNDAKAKDFVTRVFKNAPVLPKDAREASDVFFKKGQGDVLLNYENEVILEQQQLGGKSSYVIPSVNISIDAPIAVVDKNVDKHGTRAVSEAFAKFLFTPEAQREFASVGFRPVNATVASQVGGKFPKVSKLFTVAEFGGWDAVQNKFFNDGGVFDKIYSR